MTYDILEKQYGKRDTNFLRESGKFIPRDILESDIYVNDFWKSRIKTLVQVSGIFDLPHGGHTTYLREASYFGDELIVSLNSDASTERCKGKGHPYMNFIHRALILCSMEMVDYVTGFDESDPSTIIGIIAPDIYVKGWDTIIDTNTPELKTIFKTSSLRLTSEEGHLSFHTSDILEKIRNGK
jgi:D-beta-D-heptose 7-phosphate kinase/D-beta-D-heptose 1-phosphate adenosyltransferase